MLVLCELEISARQPKYACDCARESERERERKRERKERNREREREHEKEEGREGVTKLGFAERHVL